MAGSPEILHLEAPPPQRGESLRFFPQKTGEGPKEGRAYGALLHR
jgi:hypothetical protein